MRTILLGAALVVAVYTVTRIGGYMERADMSAQCLSQGRVEFVGLVFECRPLHKPLAESRPKP